MLLLKFLDAAQADKLFELPTAPLKLTFNDYKKILDEVASMNAAAKIIFTGGEPLFSPLTLPVARYAKASGFDCRLMTNAMLINEQNADELANLFETIKISVDGSDATRHDFYRGKAHVVPYSDIDLVIKQHVNNAGVLKCAMGDGEFSISRSGDVYLCQLLKRTTSAKRATWTEPATFANTNGLRLSTVLLPPPTSWNFKQCLDRNFFA